MPVDVIGIDHVYVTVRDLAVADYYATFFAAPTASASRSPASAPASRQRMANGDTS
jgi:hypothetical protein